MTAPGPSFRFVCTAAALHGSPAGWAKEMLRDGEIALLASGGVEAIDAVARDLDQVAIQLVRSEPTPAQQDQTVIAYAATLPLIWVAPEFSERAQTWARSRGPMTLLVQRDGPLDDEERRRIDRFVAILGRQSE